MERDPTDASSATPTATSEEVATEPVEIPEWKKMLYQTLFLLGAAAFFLFVNYIFGFMKGN